MPNKAPTLAAKKAYFAKVRRSNYMASLRLEGFRVDPAELDKPLPSKEAVIQKYLRKVNS